MPTLLTTLALGACLSYASYGRKLSLEAKECRGSFREDCCEQKLQEIASKYKHRVYEECRKSRPMPKQMEASSPLVAFSLLLLALHSATGWQATSAGRGRLAVNDVFNKKPRLPAARLIEVTKFSADLVDDGPSSSSFSQLLLGRTAARQGPPMAEFLTWLRNAGAFTDRIYLGNSTVGGGQGVFLAEDAKKNDLLFRVPTRACIKMQNVLDDPECGDFFKRLIDENDDGPERLVAFCGFLVKKWLTEGPDGKDFGPYLSILPWAKLPDSAGQEHILWWSDADVRALDGSPVYEDVTDMRESVDVACSALGPVLTQLLTTDMQRQQEQPLSTEQVEQLACEALRGAFVIHFSRALTIPKDPDTLAGKLETLPVSEQVDGEWFVPVLDFIQHDILDEPMVGYYQYGDAIDVVCLRDKIPKGTELFISYGELPPYAFLPHFGFVDGSCKPPLELVRRKDPLLFG